MYYCIGDKLFVTELIEDDEITYYYNRTKNVVFSEKEKNSTLMDGDVLVVPKTDDEFQRLQVKGFIDKCNQDEYKRLDSISDDCGFTYYYGVFYELTEDMGIINEWGGYYYEQQLQFYIEWCKDNNIPYSTEQKRFSSVEQAVECLKLNDMLAFSTCEDERYIISCDEDKHIYIVEDLLGIPVEAGLFERIKYALTRRKAVFRKAQDLPNVKIKGLAFRELFDELETIN